MNVRYLIFKAPLLLLLGIGLIFTSCEDDDVDPDDDSGQQDPGDDDDDDDEPEKPYEETIQLDCQLDEDMVLEQVEDVDVDYFVSCPNGASITADIEVEAGVVIMFANQGFTVSDNGSLSIIGEEDNPVMLRGGELDVAGSWSMLAFESNNPANRLEHAVINGAGDEMAETPAVVATHNANVSIVNTTIEHSLNNGLMIAEEATIEEFSENHFNENGGYPVELTPDNIGVLDSISVYDDNNGEESIFVSGGDVSSDQTWNGLNTYLYFDGSVEVDAELKINAGLELVFNDDRKFHSTDGFLNINGTKDDPVIFRGNIESPGYWAGIEIESNHPDNLLNHVEVYHGVNNVELSDGQAAFTHSLFAEAEEYGLLEGDSRTDEGSITEFLNNTFSNNGEAGVSIRPENVHKLDNVSSYDEDNHRDYILVNRSGNIHTEVTWNNLDAYYVFTDQVEIYDKLTIEAGTDLRFRSDGELYIRDEGQLEAMGNSNEIIRFRGEVVGENAPRNQWRGLRLGAPYFQELSFVDIAHGRDANITVRDGFNVFIVESTIRDTEGYGIRQSRSNVDGNLFLEEVTFENIDMDDVEKESWIQ